MTSTDDVSTGTETVEVTTKAGDAFIAPLSDDQREVLLHDCDDETKTTSWWKI